jgi:6-phosphogluconolactonase/glucosamine-6-phosphate isomerase/deaminase
VLNHARNVIFLVSGAEKAPTLNAVLNDPDNDLPAGRIHPCNGKLTWLVDRLAATLL